VIIKVDLGILKVLVEAHGSRVEFVWHRLQVCDYVIEMPYHGTSKETCREKDRTRYGWYQMMGSRTSNYIARQNELTTFVNGSHDH
jgi:hypothetical protein